MGRKFEMQGRHGDQNSEKHLTNILECKTKKHYQKHKNVKFLSDRVTEGMTFLT